MKTTFPALLSRLLSPVLDATVVLSFDRTGHLVHRLGFDADDVAVDLHGKVCAVTGASGGLGEAAALALARRGATVYFLCRNRERGLAAIDRVAAASASTDLHLEEVDLASLASIRALASRFPAPALDVLVQNAGVLPLQRSLSEDGIELTFATNVVGPFLLTALLMPRLQAAAQGRVVTVSSGGMYGTRLDLDDWQQQQGSFDGVAAYALSKRAEVILSEMWAEEVAGTRVTCNAMHPGWADTDGVRTSLPNFHRLMRPLLRSPAEGADTIVWLSVAPGLAETSGLFFFDRARRSTHWLPWTRESAEQRRRLWDLCARLAGLQG